MFIIKVFYWIWSAWTIPRGLATQFHRPVGMRCWVVENAVVCLFRTPLDVTETNQLSTDKRWVPYDASELVSSSERPAQRYSLLDQCCSGDGGLDFALLQKSSLHCLETLLKDMYARLNILDMKCMHPTHSVDVIRKKIYTAQHDNSLQTREY